MPKRPQGIRAFRCCVPRGGVLRHAAADRRPRGARVSSAMLEYPILRLRFRFDWACPGTSERATVGPATWASRERLTARRSAPSPLLLPESNVLHGQH